jgi:hypothetical protein
LEETFTASLAINAGTPVDGHDVDVTDTGTGTIIDDDTAEITIEATTQAAEDATNGEFTLSTTKQFQSPVTVDFTLAGSTATPDIDYASIGTSVVFPALSSTQTIPVTVSTDTIVEANETVIVTLTGTDHLYVNIGTPNNATVTISDDDTTTISITATDATASEPADDGVFTVSLDGGKVAPTGGIDVTYEVDATSTASSGSDYTALSGTLTIAAGAGSETITVDVWGDNIVESDETVIVNLLTENHVGTTIHITNNTDTVTIYDDDTAEVDIAKTTDGDEEGPVDGVFTVTQSLPSSADTELSYSVGGSATSGDDYTALSGNVTISAMDTEVTITVPVLNDILDEGTETVILTISISSGDDQITVGTEDNATIDILDNDFTIKPVAGPGGSMSPGTDQVV